jgi:hypothetical protein
LGWPAFQSIGLLAGMELRHLRYYVAVVEAQDLSLAAQQLVITQPAGIEFELSVAWRREADLADRLEVLAELLAATPPVKGLRP